VWPVSVTSAEWTTPSQLRSPLRALDAAHALRLVVNSAPDAPLPKLGLDRLRFHLTGENNLVHALYELLCSKLTRIVVRDPSNPKVRRFHYQLPRCGPVGFAEDEGMAPYPLRSHIGYRILQEFFALPSKFLFVDIAGLDEVWGRGLPEQRRARLPVFQCRRRGARAADRDRSFAQDIRLGCVPIVNLFPQTTEPILLDQRKYEYEIKPDIRRPAATEVFSVDGVNSIDSDTHEIVTYRPFYSYRQATAGMRKRMLLDRQPAGFQSPERRRFGHVHIAGGPFRPHGLPDVDTLTVAHYVHQPEPARAPAFWQCGRRFRTGRQHPDQEHRRPDQTHSSVTPPHFQDGAVAPGLASFPESPVAGGRRPRTLSSRSCASTTSPIPRSLRR